jgi:hypothetical protein
MKVETIIPPENIHREGKPKKPSNIYPKLGQICTVVGQFWFGDKTYYSLQGFDGYGYSSACFKIVKS